MIYCKERCNWESGWEDRFLRNESNMIVTLEKYSLRDDHSLEMKCQGKWQFRLMWLNCDVSQRSAQEDRTIVVHFGFGWPSSVNTTDVQAGHWLIRPKLGLTKRRYYARKANPFLRRWMRKITLRKFSASLLRLCYIVTKLTFSSIFCFPDPLEKFFSVIVTSLCNGKIHSSHLLIEKFEMFVEYYVICWK